MVADRIRFRAVIGSGAKPAGDPFGDGDGAQVRVRARDRRHDRGVRDKQPLDAQYRATWVDDRPDRTGAGGVEDAPDLASKIAVEQVMIAGAELTSAARLLGKRPHERDAAREAVEVVRFGEEAVSRVLSARTARRQYRTDNTERLRG
jgi:hypothetical protein